jgi:hypothetical protein
VNLPMRRTMLLALSASLLLLPSTAHAGGSANTVLKDCFDDGVLQGHYTTAQLRDAQNHMPTDIDEYSDCRDVLSRALDAATASKTSGSSSGGGNGASPTGGSSSSSPSSTPAAGSTPAATSAPDAANLSDQSIENTKLPAPYTPQDHTAVDGAAKAGEAQLKSATVPSQRLAATVGRNDVPGILIGVLALLVAASLALLVKPLLRVVGRR